MPTRRTKHKTPRNRYNEKQVLHTQATDRPEGTKTYIVTIFYEEDRANDKPGVVKWSTDVYATDIMEAGHEGMAAMDVAPHHVLQLELREVPDE